MGKRALEKVQKYEDLRVLDERAESGRQSAPSRIPTSEDVPESPKSSEVSAQEGIDVPQVNSDNSAPEIPAAEETPQENLSGSPPNECGEISNMQFLQKIWYIVNNPYYHCMFWTGINCDNNTLFTTSNYQSLVRQLNLYGFRKVKRSHDNPTYPVSDL